MDITISNDPAEIAKMQSMRLKPLKVNYGSSGSLFERPAEWDDYSTLPLPKVKYVDPSSRFGMNPLGARFPFDSHTECPLDDYRLLKDGRIRLIRKTYDKMDTLYASNPDGIDRHMAVDKGILNNKSTKLVKNPNDNKTYQYDILKVNGDAKAKALFEFVGKYSNVEWSISMVGKAGGRG